jgi:hypothetical protein
LKNEDAANEDDPQSKPSGPGNGFLEHQSPDKDAGESEDPDVSAQHTGEIDSENVDGDAVGSKRKGTEDHERETTTA